MTKLSALRMAIEALEREKKMISHSMLVPIKGMEKEYNDIDSALRQLRDIAQGLQTEPVRRALADWQKELMADPEPKMKL